MVCRRYSLLYSPNILAEFSSHSIKAPITLQLTRSVKHSAIELYNGSALTRSFRNCTLSLMDADNEIVHINNITCQESLTNDPAIALSEDGELMIVKQNIKIWSFRVLSPLSNTSSLIMKENSTQCFLTSPRYTHQEDALVYDYSILRFDARWGYLIYWLGCRHYQENDSDICTAVSPVNCQHSIWVWWYGNGDMLPKETIFSLTLQVQENCLLVVKVESTGEILDYWGQVCDPNEPGIPSFAITIYGAFELRDKKRVVKQWNHEYVYGGWNVGHAPLN